MAQVLTLRAKGLYTSWSEFAEVPEGALLVADNVNISSDNIVEPRKGFDRLATGFSFSDFRAAQFFFYQSRLFAHNGPLDTPTLLSYFDSGVWTTADSKSAPSGVRMRYAPASQNMYYTTTVGVFRLDAYNSVAALSGAVKALDLQAAQTGGSGFLTSGNTCAYRIVWGFKDANKNLIIGAPSSRFEITASGSDRDVNVTFSIPATVTTSYFYQIYRSAQVTGATPNDELQLVYEGNPTAGEIAAGTVTVLDIVPDDLRGATLYTSPSQEGIAFSNERAPLCKDLATFSDVMFYANTTSKHRYTITLLAVGGASGIVVNDTVRFGGITYTARAAENIAAGEFFVAGGTAAEAIRDTALSLVRVINRRSSSTVYAYYLSGPNDLPGQILLEERGIGGAAFSIRASRPASWSPSGIPTGGDAETSTNDNLPNGLSWSKPFQPEAVPLVNQVQVGTKNSAILRIVPLKDSLIIFKDDGIYRLTGVYPSFNIELMDSSAKLIGSETPAILNNQIFCLTDQGVVAIADSVKIISRPIEDSIIDLITSSLTLVTSSAYGCSYEAERRYYLLLPSVSIDTAPTQMFVYNVFTQTWVRSTIKSTAAIASTNELYFGDANSNFVIKERRIGNATDFGDFKSTTTITTVNATTFSVSSVAGIEVGDVIYQSATVYTSILAVNIDTNTLTVPGTSGFTSGGSATIYTSVKPQVTWIPTAAGNPGITKHFHTVQALFKKDFVGQGYITAATDVEQAETEIPIVGSEYAPWGVFSWGNTPWGGEPIRRPVRQWLPRNQQRCSLLTIGFKHNYAFSAWQLQGMSLHLVPGTEKTDR